MQMLPPSPPTFDQVKNITFVLTEDCNLRCTYCYLSHKNSRRRMEFGVARRCVDLILERRDISAEPRVVWDFIGGEPLLELSLMERIVEHVINKAYILDHPWFSASTFAITTNGLLYRNPEVVRFVERYRDLLDITLSIDGPREVHDRVRVTKGGRGSYDTVRKSVALWLEHFPWAATKVTISHDNVDSVATSILHLFELGITRVNANVVFENVWEEGDDLVLEEQLDRLADEMIARGLWRTHTCSFFQRNVGKPIGPDSDNRNWCGSGRMLAIDAEGKFYPCNRFLEFSLSKRTARPIGSVDRGIDHNLVRPFLALTRRAQSPEDCLSCGVASGCAWCQALNYEEAATPTIYRRATFLCKMHKARVRANGRFWKAVDAIAEGECVEKARRAVG